MKISKKTASIAGIIFIILMFGSTIAYTYLQGYRGLGSQSDTGVPTESIVNSSITQDQMYALLQKGKVVTSFVYNTDCPNCTQTKDYLEQFTQKYSSKLFLQEISYNQILTNRTLPIVTVIGFQYTGGKLGLKETTLEGLNVTQNNIFNTYCNSMLEPPVECALGT